MIKEKVLFTIFLAIYLVGCQNAEVTKISNLASVTTVPLTNTSTLQTSYTTEPTLTPTDTLILTPEATQSIIKSPFSEEEQAHLSKFFTKEEQTYIEVGLVAYEAIFNVESVLINYDSYDTDIAWRFGLTNSMTSVAISSETIANLKPPEDLQETHQTFIAILEECIVLNENFAIILDQEDKPFGDWWKEENTRNAINDYLEGYRHCMANASQPSFEINAWILKETGEWSTVEPESGDLNILFSEKIQATFTEDEKSYLKNLVIGREAMRMIPRFLMTAGMENPELALKSISGRDSDWMVEFITAKDALGDAYAIIIQLDPPDSLQDIHQTTIEMMRVCTEASKVLAETLESKDDALIEQKTDSYFDCQANVNDLNGELFSWGDAIWENRRTIIVAFIKYKPILMRILWIFLGVFLMACNSSDMTVTVEAATTNTPGLTATPIPTNTLESKPKTASTSRQPIDKQAYLDSLEIFTEAIRNELEVLYDLSGNNIDWIPDLWRQELQPVMDDMINVHEMLITLEPPDSLKEVHEDILKTSSDCIEINKIIMEALDIEDSELFENELDSYLNECLYNYSVLIDNIREPIPAVKE